MSTPGSQAKVEIPTSDDKLVQWWRKRIDLGIKWRQKRSGKDDVLWWRYKNYYKGDWGDEASLFSGDELKIDDYLPTNRVFSYIRSIVPRVYFRNPGIIVTRGLVRNGIDDRFVIQDVANYLTKELRIKKMMKNCVLKTMLLGTGVVKEGFGSQYTSGVERNPEGNRSIEHAAYIKPGLPWAQSIDPTNFVVPYGTKNFEDADWCAHGIWRPLEYAQADKNYKHRESFVGKMIPRTPELVTGAGSPPEPEDVKLWVRLWEIHDKATKQLLVISDGSELLHYKGEDVLQIEHLPFRILVFDEDPDSMWGIPTVKIMEPQQLELNDIRTMEAKYRRRDFTKILVDDAVIDEEALQKLNDASEPMAIVRIPDPHKNVMVVTTSMPRDLPAAGEEADNDMRFEIGFSRNQAGEVSTGRRTAREIEVARQATEIRNDERRDEASDLYTGLIDDLIQASFLLMSPEMIKRIADAVWHSRESDMLPYNLGLEVNPEEARPVSTSLQRVEASELYDRLMQNSIINPLAPLAKLLQAYGEDVEEYIDPEIASAISVVLRMREEKAARREK